MSRKKTIFDRLMSDPSHRQDFLRESLVFMSEAEARKTWEAFGGMISKYSRVGKHLHKLRTAEELSVDELARRVDAKPNTIRRIESGEREMSTSLAERIAYEFKTDIGPLLGDLF